MIRKSQVNYKLTHHREDIQPEIIFGVLGKLYSPLRKIHLCLKSQPCPSARERIAVGAGKCSFLVCFVFLRAHVWLSQHMSGYLITPGRELG